MLKTKLYSKDTDKLKGTYELLDEIYVKVCLFHVLDVFNVNNSLQRAITGSFLVHVNKRYFKSRMRYSNLKKDC